MGSDGKMNRQRKNNNEIDVSVLIKMKKELEDKKDSIKIMEGKRNGFYEQLEKEFECDSFESGEQKLKKLENLKNKKQEELNSGIEKLQDGYEWEF